MVYLREKGFDMSTTQLNNELNLTYPDGFKVMTPEDLKQYKFFEEAPGFCINDADRHIIISVSWRQSNPFVAMLVSSADIAKNMEAKIRKPMGQYGYTLEGFMSREVGGKTADGYRYAYEVKGIGMVGESLSLKSGGNFYYIHSYFRQELREPSLQVLDKVFTSVTWEE